MNGNGNGNGNGKPFEIWLEEGNILCVSLIGFVDNQSALELEQSVDSMIKRIPDLEHILIWMKETKILSSRAITLIVNLQKRDDIIFFEVPQSVLDRIPNKKLCDDLKGKEMIASSFKELLDKIQGH